MQLQASESTTLFTPEVRSVLLALKDPVVAGDENDFIIFLNHALRGQYFVVELPMPQEVGNATI